MEALPIKIGKIHYGYMLVGYYLYEPLIKEDLSNLLKKLSKGINSNNNIFKIDKI